MPEAGIQHPRRRARWPYVIVPAVVVLLGIAGWVIVETSALLSAKPNPVLDYHTPMVEEALAMAGKENGPERALEWQRFATLLAEADAILTAANQRMNNPPIGEPRQPRWYGDEYPSFDYILLDPQPPRDIEPELAVIEELRAAGVFERLAQSAAQAPIIEPPVTGESLSERLLPSYGHIRELSRVRVAMMRLAFAGGDFAEAAQAFDEVMALAQSAGSQVGLISALVGGAIQFQALSNLRCGLNEVEFDEASCRRLLRTLEERTLPPLEFALESERAVFFDTVQWSFTDDGRGSGYLLPEQVADFTPMAPGGMFGGGGPKRDQGFVAAFRARWRLADRRETVEKYNAIMDEIIAEARTPRRDRSQEILEGSAVRVLPPKFWVVASLTPAFGRVVEGRERLLLDIEATRVMVAIELFHAVHAAYPRSLDELMPEYLEALPIDAYSGATFGYRLFDEADEHGRAYLLYSFGLDGRDDGGAEGTGDLAHREDTALADPNSQGFDFILNRPRETFEESRIGERIR